MVHVEQPWWSLEQQEVLQGLNTKIDGLSDTEAEKRLEVYGYNTIPERGKSSPLTVFLRQFNDPLIYILMVSVLVLFYLQQTIEMWIVFAVILVNASVGFIQEWKAERTVEALKKLMVVSARVMRGGQVREVDSTLLVPGDVIYLESGMKVPADARLIRSTNLRVDESMLTGESEPVDKTPEPVDADTLLPDRKCMVYAGTLVVEGNGTAIVVATGGSTELGKISGSVQEEVKVETPMIKRVKKFGKQLSLLVLLISVFNFSLGVIRGYDTAFTFLASVSLAVAVIPESLPALITMSLAMGVRDMARKRAVVRKLPAVETLGSVTVICTDKTGTLTQNRMRVVSIQTLNRTYSVTGDGIFVNGVQVDSKTQEDLRRILEAGYICNKGIVERKGDGVRFLGDPTEAALLEVAVREGVTPDYELIDEIPFDSKRKFMAVAVRKDGKIMIYVKGSPEVVVDMTGDGHAGMAEVCASQGIRVLAFACKEVEEFNGIILEDLDFLGFQCLIDPLREDSQESVAKCREAGIRVVMITGDHPATALYIAKQLGIGEEVVTGWELERMDIKDAIRKYSVFARVSPEQKLEIVKAFQELDEIVAVTGDGINDAPALKRADVGVAMGSGSDAAKEAADIVLLDDSFSTIVDAVEEGRNVFRKIQRIIAWTLPTNGGEGLIVLSAFLLALQLPVLPVQILWINTVTAVLLGITLVFEPMEGSLLRLKPTKSELINRTIGIRILYVSILIVLIAYAALWLGGRKESIAMNAIIACEAWYLLTAHIDRSIRETGFRNRALLLGIILIAFLQIAVTNTPFGTILKLQPLSPFEWLTVALISLAVFIAVETEKALRRHGKREKYQA